MIVKDQGGFLRVLIINPPLYQGEKYVREGRCEQRASSFQYLMVPISLPSIAAVLRSNGFDVKVLDCMAESFEIPEALKVARFFKPDLAIINFSTATFPGDTQFTLELKKALPKTHLAGIGVHLTALPEESLIETALDSIIRGEPEMTALGLALAIQKKHKFKTVQGLSFRGNPSFINNPARPFIENLNLLPFPARDLLKNDRYKMPIYNRPYTLVITGRGCPNDCSFCTAKLYYGKKIRMRDPENVLNEVEQILREDKIRDITFWADTFTYNRNYVLKICREILERNLKFRWMCNARVDRVDEEMLKIMKKAGCQIISFGVESGCQKILNHIGKNITLKQTLKTFEMVRQAGLESAAHIIFGLPGETEETIKQTISFVKKLNPDYIQFYSAIPFPGTRFYDEALEKGWIKAKSWDEFELGRNIIDTPQLPVETLAKWRKKAYLQFYLRPSYIYGRLKRFVKKPSDIIPFTRQALSFIFDWVEK